LIYITCLHDQNKSGFFRRAGFFPANQGFLKTFQIALIGWKKPGKTKVAILEGQLLFSQSEQSEMFSKSPAWLEKSSAFQKSHFYFDHVNRLLVSN